MNFQYYTTWVLGKVDNSHTKIARVVFVVCDTLRWYELVIYEV